MLFAHGAYYTFFSIYLVEHGYDKGFVGWLWAIGAICEIGVFHYALADAAFPPEAYFDVQFACAVLRLR